jgi:hypothetical protein
MRALLLVAVSLADGCNPACALGCDHIAAKLPSRDDIGACTQRAAGGSYRKLRCGRCGEGYRPVKGSDFGCEAGEATACDRETTPTATSTSTSTSSSTSTSTSTSTSSVTATSTATSSATRTASATRTLDVFARTCAAIRSQLSSGNIARVFPDSAGEEGARRYCMPHVVTDKFDFTCSASIHTVTLHLLQLGVVLVRSRGCITNLSQSHLL